MALVAQRGEHGRLLLQLLESVEQDGSKSQRQLAAELGVALGLVNAYLNRCIQKGLVKVSLAPARRFAYYLTPRGFIEKSRLSIEYLTYSFNFFREAKLDCVKTFTLARECGFLRIALEGASDLAEIAIICARNTDVQVIGIVDAVADRDRLVGVPVVGSYDELPGAVDGLVITRIGCTHAELAVAVDRFGVGHVLVPSLLLKAIGNGRETVL